MGLTEEEIEQLTASQELDHMIRILMDKDWNPKSAISGFALPYSSSETEAFRVLRWLNDKFGDARMRLMWDFEICDGEFIVEIATDWGTPSYYYSIAEAGNRSAALAICKATLLAVEWLREWE